MLSTYAYPCYPYVNFVLYIHPSIIIRIQRYFLLDRIALFLTLPALKRRREQEPETPQKFQKIFGATSILGTKIFETIAEKSEAELSEKGTHFVRTTRVLSRL